MKNNNYPDFIEVYIETKSGNYRTYLEKTSLEGGEGIIYRTRLVSKHNNSKLVVKLFKENIAEKKEKKISNLISFFKQLKKHNYNTYRQIRNYTIIPLGRVFSLKREFIGFVMEYVDMSNSISLSKFSLDPRFKSYKHVGYYERLIISYRLTKAVNLLHNAGFTIGDLNSDNVLISQNGSLYLVDTDNYGFIYNNTYYPPSAIRHDIAPPEILEQSHINSISKKSDIYSLAIHIYSIFMLGFEPFNFVGSASIGDKDTLKKRGINVFTSKKPPKNLPPLDILGELLNVLPSALDPKPSKRPDASKILDAIKKNMKKISNCKNGHKVIPIRDSCFICGESFNKKKFFYKIFTNKNQIWRF